MSRSPQRRMSPAAWPLLALIGIYRYVFSPLLHLIAPGSGCRYAPTCSRYAVDALRRHGAARGSWLTVRRIIDCQPWGGHGYDPVPEAWPGWRYSRRIQPANTGGPSSENDASSSLPRVR